MLFDETTSCVCSKGERVFFSRLKEFLTSKDQQLLKPDSFDELQKVLNTYHYKLIENEGDEDIAGTENDKQNSVQDIFPAMVERLSVEGRSELMQNKIAAEVVKKN